MFAQDDWTTTDASEGIQASPRDNVVFEAGRFGGALGMRRTFILHANDFSDELLPQLTTAWNPCVTERTEAPGSIRVGVFKKRCGLPESKLPRSALSATGTKKLPTLKPPDGIIISALSRATGEPH